MSGFLCYYICNGYPTCDKENTKMFSHGNTPNPLRHLVLPSVFYCKIHNTDKIANTQLQEKAINGTITKYENSWLICVISEQNT